MARFGGEGAGLWFSRAMLNDYLVVSKSWVEGKFGPAGFLIALSDSGEETFPVAIFIRVVFVDRGLGCCLDTHGMSTTAAEDNKKLFAPLALECIWYSNHRESSDQRGVKRWVCHGTTRSSRSSLQKRLRWRQGLQQTDLQISWEGCRWLDLPTPSGMQTVHASWPSILQRI
jgi:hypothetical protein